MEPSKTPNNPAETDDSEEKSAVIWHPAFVEAIKLELEDYRDCLEFHSEYQLSAEPLRIDCVIIKKAKDVVIKKNIAAMFREVNLVEYKSPDDYVSIRDFYKVYSYACLYSSIEDIPITTLTISFVESRQPRKLLNHLKNVRGYAVEETSPGVYTVTGDILPIQIINSRRLSTDENLWLKGLSNRLNPQECSNVYQAINRQDKTEYARAYLYTITQANAMTIEEAMEMRKPKVTIEEVLERNGYYARAEVRGEERKSLAIAQNMINLGFSKEVVISATMLAPEKVEPLYQK